MSDEKQKIPLPTQMQAVMFLNANLQDVVNKILTYKGSKKQLKRILAATMSHGLLDTPLELTYTDEKELFELTSNITHAKMVLYHYAMKDQETPETKQEVSNNIQGENENGKE